jgi:23S rRNA pseudouridine2457 synthase
MRLSFITINMNHQYIAFFKPYGVLCQFTGEIGDKTLSDFNLPEGVYAAGRLDKDSEGLLILTNDGIFNQELTNPKSKKKKTYYAQVEKIPTEDSLQQLREGVTIKGGYQTLPCNARIIKDPGFGARIPPIRERKAIPDCWLEIKVIEGKNRQVRSMTASIGHPTLRLVRVSVGKRKLNKLAPGEWEAISKEEII